MSITLIHTADWQIGKAFANIEGDAGALLRVQRLKTVEVIARLATERDADAVLVAGDVFETNAVSDETLRRTVNAMRAYHGTWVLLPGNHDAALSESVWTRLQRLGTPENIVLAVKPEPIMLRDDTIAILPAPLARRHEASDVTEWFDTIITPPTALRVGLAHGSVANRLPRSSEAPNTIADTRSETGKLDYLALGDWHGTLEIAPRTWYSGTPEPDRFRDNDPGNVLVVTLSHPRSPPTVERVPVGYFRWGSFDQTITNTDDIAALDAVFSAQDHPDRLVANLRLSGTVDFAMRRQIEELIERNRARCHVLRVDDDGLIAMPSDDDLDRIDSVGFIRVAIDRLREKADNPGDQDRVIARDALQRLYLEHIRLGE